MEHKEHLRISFSMSKKYFRYNLDDLEKSANRKLFNYISFFAGGGGSSAGYKLAGGDCKFVNEFQQVAVDTYLANWPDTPHICGDIKNVTGKQIMEMTGLKEGEIDILDASPPCPPFSMSGTKQNGWGKEKTAYGMKQKNIESEKGRLASIEQNKQNEKEERESQKAILDAFIKVELEAFKKRNEHRMEMNQTYEDSLIGLDERQEERAKRIAQLEQEMQEPFLGLIGMTETFTQRLVQASIEGQNMEKILKSAVNSLAIEIASKTAIFGMLRLAGSILNPASAGGMAIETATGGGFGAFLLRGFTGQTSKVNQTININGGLISQSYVKNTLVPALNNARALG